MPAVVINSSDSYKRWLEDFFCRIICQGVIQKERNFNLEDRTEVIKEFRMSKSEIKYICDLIKDWMQPVGYRSIDFPLEQKVLICLKTLGSESFQNCSKDFIDIAQSTVSRVLSDFTETMAKLAPDFIFMPRNNNEICSIKRDFYKIAAFPGVIGCIDGLHIQIIAPHEDEFAYVNRKKFHSINIQGICDANLLFLDVVAKWRESSHDSFILQTSQVNDDFENGKCADGWLLEDSGYPLKN